jgi:predicted membrane-bound mannosyltransferase
LALALGFSAYQALDLNFNHYDDETYPYVFVHTTRDALGLVDETERLAALATGERNGIVFYTPDYWPLPWYYRDNPKAGFFGEIVDTEEAVIVANVNQEGDALNAKVDGRYERRGVFTLRPGVDLVVFVRNDLAGL